MEGVLLRVSVDQTGSTYAEVSVNRAVEEKSGAILDTTGTILGIIACDAFSQQRCVLIPTATLEGERGSQSYAQLPDRPNGTQDDRINGRGWYSDIYKIPRY